jgi:hypothetical protein
MGDTKAREDRKNRKRKTKKSACFSKNARTNRLKRQLILGHMPSSAKLLMGNFNGKRLIDYKRRNLW